MSVIAKVEIAMLTGYAWGLFIGWVAWGRRHR